MYWTYSYDYRNTFQPVWNVGYQQALELIKAAVQDERNDELFYDKLIKLAPTPEQAAIITSIRNDERSHNAMFRSMYREMTGHDVYGVSDEQYQPVRTYSEGIQKPFKANYLRSRNIAKYGSDSPYGIYKDTVHGVILDELKHASKYNYLFTLNR